MEAKKRPNRTGKPINLWIETELLDCLEAYCRKNCMTKTAAVKQAIEERLMAVGMWHHVDEKSRG